MRIIVYIDTWQNVNKTLFGEMLKIYNSFCETICIDNSGDFYATNEFLAIVENVDLDNCVYKINDEIMCVGDAINPYLFEEVLIVSNRIAILPETIMELKAVADSAEHHVFVIPRSDKGDYQTFPGPEEIVRVDERLDWLKNNMPRYSMLPCAF